jgi:hypothetical protein
MKTDGMTVLQFVRIYANRRRLQQTFRESVSWTELIGHFIRGFNSVSGLMDFVDVGEEVDIIPSKVKGNPILAVHLTGVENVESFLQLPACRLVVLGIENPEAYYHTLMSIEKREAPSCGVCLILPPVAPSEIDDISTNSQFPQANFDDIFVKCCKVSHRPSYVDVVQKHVPPSALDSKPEPSPLPIMGARKVSDASTVSTAADDEWYPDVQELERESIPRTSRSYYFDDQPSVSSDWETSELSCTTKERRLRMESRRKDVKSKKSEIGLLAVTPCPEEEPDRSTPA